MAEEQALQQMAAEARTQLDQVWDVPFSEIQKRALRSPEAGGHNLRPVTRRLTVLRELALAMHPHVNDFVSIPEEDLKYLTGNFSTLRAALQHLLNTDPLQHGSLPQAIAQAESWATTLETEALTRWPRCIVLLRRRDTKEAAAEWLDVSKQELDSLLSEAIQLRESTHEAHVQASSALEAARATAAQEAVTRQAAAFVDEMKNNAREAIAWGVGAIVVAVSLLIVVAWLLTPGQHLGPPYPKESWFVAGNLGYFAARALGISVLSYALVACVSNYRATRHNEIMNGHRFRALTTYKLLRESTTGAAADAILLRAADAIFSVQASGYSNASPPTSHIAEVAAAIGLSKGKDD